MKRHSEKPLLRKTIYLSFFPMQRKGLLPFCILVTSSLGEGAIGCSLLPAATAGLVSYLKPYAALQGQGGPPKARGAPVQLQ